MQNTKLEHEIFKDLFQIFKKHEKLFDLNCRFFTINQNNNVENLTIELTKTDGGKIKINKKKVIETEDCFD